MGASLGESRSPHEVTEDELSANDDIPHQLADPHALSSQDVVGALGTDPADGLQEAEAGRRLAAGGPNALEEAPRPGILAKFAAQFNDFLIWVLLAAAAIAAVVAYIEGSEYVDSIAIIAIVVLNACIGVFQEHRAENALRALQAMAAPEAMVVRSGRRVVIPAAEVVVGDLVVLETGNYVPADLRLTETVNLRLNEAPLTGESVPVLQRAADICAADAPLGDRRNMAHRGSVVAYGRGTGVVTATGMQTAIGRIADLIQSYEDEPTPLQERLDGLGRTLGLVTLVVCGIVFAVGLLRETDLSLVLTSPDTYFDVHGGHVLDLFMIAVALAIAAVPEGLPAVVTIALAIGMQRMVRRNALIRRLPAVETLGSATTICSDKTGTLTQNEMVVVEAELEGKSLEIRGEGYAPLGQVTLDGEPFDPAGDPDLQILAAGATLASDAIIEPDGEGWRLVGDPTEGALVAFAARVGLAREVLSNAMPRVAEIPFESERKRMTTIHEVVRGPGFALPLPADAGAIAFVKGAPDVILGLSSRYHASGGPRPLDDQMRQRVNQANLNMAKRALRVLGVAYRPLDEVPEDPQPDDIESDLVIVGLVGIIDPPRPEVSSAVGLARAAGVRTIMITGDHRDTAVAIARAINLVGDDAAAVTGAELSELPAGDLLERVSETDIYARVSPEHKVDIVEALKHRGEIVAMTGDGVNDAPALKRAHIGVAMGITGTDVSRETADMVLTDDNYASIVAAIEEGRTIYDNIRKFVFYLISCNIGEILTIFIAMVAGLAAETGQAPLLPIHLLWLNLVTDGLPALALGLEEPEPDVMRRPPRDPSEPVLSRDLWPVIAVQSTIIPLATLTAFMWAYSGPDSIRYAQTVAFATLVTAELLRAYTSRSQEQSILRMGLTSNRYMVLATVSSLLLLLIVLYLPALTRLFQTVPLSPQDWIPIAFLATWPAIAAELAKAWRRRDPPTSRAASEASGPLAGAQG